jgi:hypothetical protein
VHWPVVVLQHLPKQAEVPQVAAQ